MKVIVDGDVIELGTTEAQPTIGMVDYSRRVTDEFGITTVVERGFARRMSVRAKVPTDEVDGLQRTLADLRASAAEWVADERFDSLSFAGFYKDFSIDLAVPPTSFCTLTIEGLTETSAGPDDGTDPAPDARSSTLQLLQPQTINDGVLTSINVLENDQPVWAIGTTYALGARVIRAHRQWESLIAGNLGNEPSADSTVWLDIGPTNRWAMLDDALGTATTNAGSIVATFDPVAAVTALALLDVSAATVRVQAPGYDRTIAPTANPGMAAFLDMPPTTGVITVTVSGAGTVSVGTLMMGQLVGLGITEASPTAGITDFSRKETDDFGDVTVVERAWAKQMGVRAMLRTDAIDQVFDRIATVRARPCLWVGSEELEALSIYGFFKEFSIEVGESISTLALSVEGLSKAAPLGPGFGAQIEALSGLLTDLAETVDAKRTVFTQPNAPTAAESEENDWWQQTNGAGAIIATYRRVAGTGRLAIGGNAILLGGSYIGLCWAPVDDARIGSALAAATAASNLADSKAVVFTMYASSDPVPTGTDIGDILVRAYLSPVQVDYWNGSTWVAAATYGATAAQITLIGNALTSAANAQATADGKVDTYYQTSAPTGATVGDLWFDTDDGNKLYRHNGTGWVAAQDTAIGQAITAAAGAQATADGKVTTYVGEAAPGAPALGDLWFKASTNVLSRWNGAAWGTVSSLGAPSGTNVGTTPATTVESGANAANNGLNADGTAKTDKVGTGAIVAGSIHGITTASGSGSSAAFSTIHELAYVTVAALPSGVTGIKISAYGQLRYLGGPAAGYPVLRLYRVPAGNAAAYLASASGTNRNPSGLGIQTGKNATLANWANVDMAATIQHSTTSPAAGDLYVLAADVATYPPGAGAWSYNWAGEVSIDIVKR